MSEIALPKVLGGAGAPNLHLSASMVGYCVYLEGEGGSSYILYLIIYIQKLDDRIVRSSISIRNTLPKLAYVIYCIFNGCKNDNLQMKNCDIFLIFAQNIDCAYTLEPPQ